MSGAYNDLHLKYFRFVGRFLGKVLLDHQTIPAQFSLPLLKHIIGIPISFSDMEFVDGEMYQNLLFLRDNPGAEALCLDFTVTYEVLGEIKVVELKPGGAAIDVTDENKFEYLELLFKHRMLGSVQDQMWHLLTGLYEVNNIGERWRRLLHAAL